MASIKQIILDLGGVIIDLDYERSLLAFENLGIVDFRQRFTQAAQTPEFDAFDKGQISSAEFREYLRRLVNLDIDDRSIDTAWNAMLIGFPADRIDFLRKLSAKLPLYLLSNTNVIHVEAFTAMLRSDSAVSDFERFFRKVYYSCRIGMRKPDEEIFRFVLNENNLEPGETLFIDDSPQHVRGALACGLQAMCLDVQAGEKLENRLYAVLAESGHS